MKDASLETFMESSDEIEDAFRMVHIQLNCAVERQCTVCDIKEVHYSLAEHYDFTEKHNKCHKLELFAAGTYDRITSAETMMDLSETEACAMIAFLDKHYITKDDL